MTEGSIEDGTFLVRVRAQVMTRDDSTGGWVPMGGGGLSNVSVYKKMTVSAASDGDEETSVAKPEYQIYGKRICDQTVVLSCSIKKDFQYNKVMPTFHHWKTGDKKFGLTFQTAADARAFAKSIRNAIEDLLDETDPVHNLHDTDVGDDDVFMTLELPVDSHSSSGSSSESGNGICAYRPTSTTPSITRGSLSATSSPHAHFHGDQHNMFHVQVMRPSQTMPGVNNSGAASSLSMSVSAEPADLQRLRSEVTFFKKNASVKEQQSTTDSDKIESYSPGDPYSYVHFAAAQLSCTEHEYSYPTIESIETGPQEGGSGSGSGSFSMPCQAAAMAISESPVHTDKKVCEEKENICVLTTTHFQCRHCLDIFSEEDNHRGSCEYAPDRVLTCVNVTTCISCAQCMLYHCMSDAEGDYNHHPCSCGATDDHCHRRWTGLALLSIFVPCLWCYLPLRACHRCGVSCGICGGRHEAQ